jgi:hypothetical protein
MTWMPFFLVFGTAIAFALAATALRGMGYDVGREWGEDL